MVDEIWKDIEGYEGLYQVSNLGRVKSSGNFKSKNARKTQKILKNILQNNGYYGVTLRKGGKSTRKNIHRLVAEAFIPNPYNKPCIDHINTIRTDNSIENLRWCTEKENNQNPISTKKQSKPVYQYTLSGEFVREWVSVASVNRFYGVKNTKVCDCCNGKRKTYKGYSWSYNRVNIQTT